MIPVNANANQEREYNSRSLLDDNYAYDIICAAYPSYGQPNYSSKSCAIRLEEKTCRHGDCVHFKGEKPKRKPQKYGKEYKDAVRGKKSERVRECASCHEQKWIVRSVQVGNVDVIVAELGDELLPDDNVTIYCGRLLIVGRRPDGEFLPRVNRLRKRRRQHNQKCQQISCRFHRWHLH